MIETEEMWGITRNPGKKPNIWSRDKQTVTDMAKDFMVESGNVYIIKATIIYGIDEVIENDRN